MILAHCFPSGGSGEGCVCQQAGNELKDEDRPGDSDGLCGWFDFNIIKGQLSKSG